MPRAAAHEEDYTPRWRLHRDAALAAHAVGRPGRYRIRSGSSIGSMSREGGRLRGMQHRRRSAVSASHRATAAATEATLSADAYRLEETAAAAAAAKTAAAADVT
mmetsp:Transcript_36114/g.106697  ORF Transcript_36114/g.106697 Transcript_36114/m.106697 type:complete len:105 (-) Transcript_36114:38-352(-)